MIFQRALAAELSPLIRKDSRKFARPKALKDFADHAEALAESHKALKSGAQSSLSSVAPITARRLSTINCASSRSTEGSNRQGVLVVEGQDAGNTDEATKEEEDSTILTQEVDNDSHVFSIRALPSRRPSFCKRLYKQTYLRKQKLKAKLTACFECLDPFHLSPDYPYNEVDRTPEFHNWLEGNLSEHDPALQ